VTAHGKADSAAAAKPLSPEPPPHPGVDASREEKHAWLEELAHYQGVKPLSFEEHAKLWPFGENEVENPFEFVFNHRGKASQLRKDENGYWI